MVEVSGSNLYVNGVLIQVEADEVMLLRDPLVIAPSEDDQFHKLLVDERLTQLAYKYYSPFVSNPSRYWWVIADANGIQNPLDLEDFVGTDILIPNIVNLIANLGV